MSKPKLKTYTVNGYITMSVVKQIRARSEEDAREKAANLSCPSICHQCSGAGQGYDDTWELNGFDDVPDDAVMGVELAE